LRYAKVQIACQSEGFYAGHGFCKGREGRA
jgi:hypothetical protein